MFRNRLSFYGLPFRVGHRVHAEKRWGHDTIRHFGTRQDLFYGGSTLIVVRNRASAAAISNRRDAEKGAM